MPLQTITKIKGRGVYVKGDDIDTDRIIPARFMKCLTFDGLGEFLFYDVCRNEAGAETAHPLNDPRFAGATILITGKNFGCGSSREHAPQAIYRAGFRAIIAEGYAEIFSGNAINLGIVCVAVPASTIHNLIAAIEANPEIDITLDLNTLSLTYGQQRIAFQLPETARQNLINGKWDPLEQLLEDAAAIDTVAASLAYLNDWR